MKRILSFLFLFAAGVIISSHIRGTNSPQENVSDEIFEVPAITASPEVPVEETPESVTNELHAGVDLPVVPSSKAGTIEPGTSAYSRCKHESPTKPEPGGLLGPAIGCVFRDLVNPPITDFADSGWMSFTIRMSCDLDLTNCRIIGPQTARKIDPE